MTKDKFPIHRAIAILIGILFVTTTFLHAQERDSLVVKKTMKHVLNDSKSWVLSPIKWDKKDWLVFGGASVVTGALILWGDQKIYNFSNDHHTTFLNHLSPYIEPTGHAYLYTAIGGFFLHGIIAKNNYSTETSIIASESLILASLLAHTVKGTGSRVRPNNYGTSNPHQWNGPFFKGNSFFSGHTTAAFSVCSVIAYRYRDTKWVPAVAYGMASLVGLQRIYNNKHWASDVFFGATVGTATGLFLCKSWEKLPIRFYPSFSPEYSQVTLVLPISK